MPDRSDGPTKVDVRAGWSERYATVLRIFTAGDLAVSLVDTNGDGREVMLELWVRESGLWGAPVMSNPFGSWPPTVGAHASGCSPEYSYAVGRAAPGGSMTVELGDVTHEVIADADGMWFFLHQQVGNEVTGLPRIH